MDQGAGRMARPGVHDQPGRLVNDAQVLVLVKNSEIHRFGVEPGWDGCRQLPAEAIAGPQPISGARGPPIVLNVSVRDQLLNPAPAQLGELPGKVLVETGGAGRRGELWRPLTPAAADGLPTASPAGAGRPQWRRPSRRR